MYTLNDKIKDLQPYEALSGEFQIRLDANESFLTLPEGIKREIESELARLPLNRYPDSTAAQLCAAFADFYSLRAENVSAGNGSDELISIIVSAFLMKGEAYATIEPDFSMYSFYGNICEAEHLRLKKQVDFSIDVDNVIEVCKNKNVKLLIFSNPCNPTSIGLPKGEVRKIIEALPEVLIVLDEAYMDFWSESMLPEIDKYSNLIILKTCSKAFGMAGIRLGFAVSSEDITRAIWAVKSPYNVNVITQAMGRIILSHKVEVRQGIDEIIASKDRLYNELRRIDGAEWKILPSKTNFIAIKMDKADEFLKFMNSNGISIRYTCGLIRVTCGNEEENRVFIDTARRFWR